MMLSNFGMGSVMYNYYRKTNDEDEDLPKVSLIVNSFETFFIR